MDRTYQLTVVIDNGERLLLKHLSKAAADEIAKNIIKEGFDYGRPGQGLDVREYWPVHRILKVRTELIKSYPLTLNLQND